MKEFSNNMIMNFGYIFKSNNIKSTHPSYASNLKEAAIEAPLDSPCIFMTGNLMIPFVVYKNNNNIRVIKLNVGEPLQLDEIAESDHGLASMLNEQNHAQDDWIFGNVEMKILKNKLKVHKFFKCLNDVCTYEVNWDFITNFERVIQLDDWQSDGFFEMLKKFDLKKYYILATTKFNDYGIPVYFECEFDNKKKL